MIGHVRARLCDDGSCELTTIEDDSLRGNEQVYGRMIGQVLVSCTHPDHERALRLEMMDWYHNQPDFRGLQDILTDVQPHIISLNLADIRAFYGGIT